LQLFLEPPQRAFKRLVVSDHNTWHMYTLLFVKDSLFSTSYLGGIIEADAQDA
jgi:hypothetical protein